MRPLHVLVGESSAVIRVGLRTSVLAGGWAAVTLTESCTQLRAAADHDVHLILVSADVECQRGADHHRRCITELSTWSRVCVLVAPHARHLGLVALSAGATAVLDLRAAPEDLRERLWAIAHDPAPKSPPVPRVPQLGPNERRLLTHYAQGRTLAECAADMRIGVETARTHLERLRAKYVAAGRPAAGRAGLLLRAIEDGYLPWPLPDRPTPTTSQRAASRGHRDR